MYRRIGNLRDDGIFLQEDIMSYLKCALGCNSNYETGKRDIPTDVLIKLADFYKTSTDHILGRTGCKRQYHSNEKTSAKKRFTESLCEASVFLSIMRAQNEHASVTLSRVRAHFPARSKARLQTK